MSLTLLFLVTLPHPWLTGPVSTTLAERFPPPEGYHRIAVDEPFAVWLRGLPVRADDTVRLYDGRIKPRQDVQAAVLDIDVGDRDLQQCADAIIRLRAEHLLSSGREDEIVFHFTSGDAARWSDWRNGLRPRVTNKVRWLETANRDGSYTSFRRYLNTVFAYAGTASLAQRLKSVEDPLEVQPGDVFIQGGYPGHAVIVVDVAENRRGERTFLLAQSYMPAQDIHVLKRPGKTSPWYPARATGALDTPEWTFSYSDLRRW